MPIFTFTQFLLWKATLVNMVLITGHLQNNSFIESCLMDHYCRMKNETVARQSSPHPLFLVAHRGPVAFQNDGSMTRNAGGLVTALTGLSSQHPITWISLSETYVKEEYLTESKTMVLNVTQGGTLYFCQTASDPGAFQLFYDEMCNTVLWFLQHHLPIPDNLKTISDQMMSYECGYRVVNKNLADAIMQHAEGEFRPIVLLQDYHAYLVPGLVRAAIPDARILHFIHIPWPSIDFWYHLAPIPRLQILLSMLDNDVIGFHTQTYCKRFLQCCKHFLGLTVDEERGIVKLNNSREVWVKRYPVPISAKATRALAYSPNALRHAAEIQQSIPEMLVVLVARSDPAKNLARTFAGFRLFLEQHSEFHARVSFVAHVVPSRLHISAYQECLQEATGIVNDVNAAFSLPNWLPINLQLSKDREHAMALLRLYDVLVVNSFADGLNLVAKEGSLINERHGVLMLSTSVGVFDELGNYTLNVQPTDEQQVANAFYSALTMNKNERKRRSRGLRQIVTSTNPDEWLSKQVDDLVRKTV